jgi:hypothetical protein
LPVLALDAFFFAQYAFIAATCRARPADVARGAFGFEFAAGLFAGFPPIASFAFRFAQYAFIFAA